MKRAPNERTSIVIGFDFSDTTHLALNHAIDLGVQHPPADLHIVHAVDEARADARAVEQRQRELSGLVRKVVDALMPGNLRLYCHARIGSPAEVILDLARESVADLVVVGTRGLSGVKRLLLGSVAERVMRDAKCPVMVVRPQMYDPKDAAEPQPEPPCPRCVEARRQTDGQQWWCEPHAGEGLQPHRYEYSHRAARTQSTHEAGLLRGYGGEAERALSRK